MQKLYVLFLFLLAGGLSAQTVIQVAPGSGTLNDAIDDYIAANGLPDLNVVFELQDGGFYVLSSTLENRFEDANGNEEDFPLHIRAAADAETRPVIRPGVPQGGESFNAFRVRDDLRLEGLYITNQDALMGSEDRILRISAENARIELVNCHLDKATQSAIRLDNNGNRIFIENCVISNIQNPSNPSNGRGIDDRGNDIDTLVIQNSTIYNLSSRILRDDGGSINYFFYNQNTSYNTGDRTLDIGEIEDAAIVTNNLFINTAFLGDDEPGSSSFQIEIDEDDGIGSEQVRITNNGFFNAPELQAAYDALNMTAVADDRDSVFAKVFFNGDSEAYIAADPMDGDTNFFYTAFEFTEAPDTPTDFVNTFYTDTDNTPNLPNADGGVEPTSSSQLPFDFAYSTDLPAFTDGTDGQPIGDRGWFGDAVSTFDPALAARLEVQAFPNPAREELNLKMQLDEFTPLTVRMFDLMGRPVGGDFRAELSVGEQIVTLPVGHLSRGQYIYQIVAGDRFTAGQFTISR